MAYPRSLAVLACVLTLPAIAQQPEAAPSAYAQVVSATPLFREVRVEVPREDCRDVQVQPQATAQQPNNMQTAAGAVVGGVLGGVLGHQVGGGRGKDVATALGAVVGAATGAKVANNYGNQPQAQPQPQTERQCQKVVDYRTEQQPDGYDVAYRYAGVTYHTHTATAPGKTLPIRVSVTPMLGDN